MNKLRIGTNVIRSFLVLGIIISIAGLIYSIVSAEADHLLLSVLFAINIAAQLAVIRILIARNLPARIKLMTKAMNRAAEGELSERVVLEGETEISLLADNFNAMMEQLSGAIKKVHASLTELRKISATIGQLSEKGVSSAAIQSECLKRTAAAIREINRSITDVSTPIVTLTSLSTSNTASMTDMSGSLEVTTRHLESLVNSVEDVSSSIIEMASSARHIKENAVILATDTSRTA
ncbi:MAG: methyl-accepting chemotaxis protein, partial [Deltaproteobacteria bacterium]|nr:methyl-accepting chemotaxis protein [Deltaproteobacteria bacterium]